MNLEKKLKRNIRIDYLFCFCRNFDLSSAVWVLYMGWRGLPLWQIGIAEGMFHVTSFLFEVPSGALADLAGRKNVMIWGRVLAAVSSVILLFSTDLWQFLIGFSISAVSYNLNSGSEEALVYDSMKMLGEEKDYIRVNSRLNVLIEVASGIAVFLGGVLAERTYITCYFAAAVAAVISIVPALFLTEPQLLKETEVKKKVSLKEHFKISIQIVRENPAGYVNSLIYPIASAALNELIPSEQRATIISIDSMCFSIAMVFFFPVTGLVAGAWNLHGAFLILGIIEIVLTAIIMWRYKKD